VCFAWAVRRQPVVSRTERFSGDREQVRRAAVKAALEGLRGLLESPPVKG
jgi:nicotinamide mononucleotide (NMN) deamidase PncC